jgi:hypothetical protein
VIWSSTTQSITICNTILPSYPFSIMEPRHSSRAPRSTVNVIEARVVGRSARRTALLLASPASTSATR